MWSYPFLLIDIALATALVFGWLPPAIADYPQFLAVRYQDILLFAVIVAGTVFALSPRLVLLAGASAPIDLRTLLNRRAVVRGTMLRSRPLEEKLARAGKSFLQNLNLPESDS